MLKHEEFETSFVSKEALFFNSTPEVSLRSYWILWYQISSRENTEFKMRHLIKQVCRLNGFSTSLQQNQNDSQISFIIFEVHWWFLVAINLSVIVYTSGKHASMSHAIALRVADFFFILSLKTGLAEAVGNLGCNSYFLPLTQSVFDGFSKFFILL